MDFAKLKPALTLRRMPQNGRSSSEDINDFMEQTVHDVGSLFDFVNGTVIPAFNGFGVIGTYADIDPITNGIDGTSVFTDRDWADITCPYMYDSGNSRPKSISETILQIVADLNQLFAGYNDVKARLGTTVDSTDSATSQATLSEVETKTNYLNNLVQQLRNSVDSYLTSTEIAIAIASGTINPSTYNIIDTDVSGNAGIAPTKISGVLLTDALTYTGGYPSHYDMNDSLLRLKEWIEDLTGETFSSYSSTNVTASGLYVAYKTHVAASGAGTVTGSNPHGLDITDLTDTSNVLQRPRLIASLDICPSGNTAYTGGYAYIPNAVTINKVAMTLAFPGTTGLSGLLYYRRSSTNYQLGTAGLSLGIGSTPGSTSSDISVTLANGDLVFFSGISGNGASAKVMLFGYP